LVAEPHTADAPDHSEASVGEGNRQDTAHASARGAVVRPLPLDQALPMASSAPPPPPSTAPPKSSAEVSREDSRKGRSRKRRPVAATRVGGAGWAPWLMVGSAALFLFAVIAFTAGPFAATENEVEPIQPVATGASTPPASEKQLTDRELFEALGGEADSTAPIAPDPDGEVKEIVVPGTAADASAATESPEAVSDPAAIAGAATVEPVPAASPPASPPVAVDPPRPAPPKPEVKSPLPTTHALVKAEESFGLKYRVRLEEAVSAEQKATLASVLLAEAESLNSQPVDRYVRLQSALELSLDAGAIGPAGAAAESLASGFETDSFMLQARVLEGLAESVRSTDQRRGLAQRCLVAADQMLAARRSEEAAAMAELALSLAQRARNATLQVQARQMRSDIVRTRKLEDENAEALTALAADSNDPVGNLHRGRYLCLVQGDWRAGLALLTKSGIDELAAAARQDMASPSDAKEQIALADAWRKLAGADPVFEGFYARSLAWYNQAKPFVVGEDLAEIGRGLKEIRRQRITTREIDLAQVASAKVKTP